MPTPNTIKIGDGVAQEYEFSTEKTILTAEWLLKQEFYIDAAWDAEFYIPYSIELCMSVRNLYAHAGDEAYVVLAKIDESKQTLSKAVTWSTEKQLEKELKKQIKNACADFSDDFLPCALEIVIRAQKLAKKWVEKEFKKRKQAWEGK